MSRLNDTIDSISYIRDALMAYRNIINSGSCNECGRKKCEYAPKPGHLVRYNCPFFRREGEGQRMTDQEWAEMMNPTMERRTDT